MSPQLKRTAEKVIHIKRILQKESLNHNDNMQKLNMYKQQLSDAYKNLRKTQKRAKEIRKEFLQELGRKQAQQWNVTASQATQIIETAEASKEMHRRHRYYVKPRGDANIKHVYVPAPVSNWTPSDKDITKEKCQTRVKDPKDVFNVLLRQNF